MRHPKVKQTCKLMTSKLDKMADNLSDQINNRSVLDLSDHDRNILIDARSALRTAATKLAILSEE